MGVQRSGLLAALVSLLALGAVSLQPRTEPLGPVLGQPSWAIVKQGETLLDIAFDHSLGFQQVVRLNPEVDVWIPEEGTRVLLPTEVILPAGPREGLLLNVPEMRLYDFRGPEGVRIVAAAVGDRAVPTPTGEFRIGRKRIDPVWNVPESIRLERPELPARVAPGPDNPLGDRWMTLGRSSYGLHGTNNRWSIGHDATHGCVRLYNRDMHQLFDRTEEGTPIRIIYQPIKLGRRGEAIYLEAHPDIYLLDRDPVASTLVQLLALGLDGFVDRDQVRRVVGEARGQPVAVGTLPPGLTSEPTS